MKKKGDEFTYFQADVKPENTGSTYTPKAQFECKGTKEEQTLKECTTTNPTPCSDKLDTFTINYKKEDSEDPETDTPAEKGNKEIGDGRELATYTAEFANNKKPTNAGDITIVTSEQSAINIMKDYTQQSACKTTKPTPKPVPANKVLTFKLKSGETVFLSDTKALKQNGEGYTYYDVGKTPATDNTYSIYTLTPVYVCDGNKQSTSLTKCEGKSDSKCEKITYNIQYTENPKKYEFVTKPDNVEGEITESNTNEAEFDNHDAEGDCPTGSDTTTKPVPDDKILKFVLGTGENAETVYLSKTQGLKIQKGGAYSYYDVDKDDKTDNTYSKYTLTPKFVCDGNDKEDSLTTCNKQKDGECNTVIYKIKYTATTPPQAEFVDVVTGLQSEITVLSSDSDVKFGDYDEANNCPTGSGGDGDGKIHPSDLSAIPQNANVKQNTTGNSYSLITDNVFYVIGKEYQLAIPVTKIQGEHNSTYSVTENTDFIKKSTGLKIKDDDKTLENFKCPASKNEFISLIWLERNCNKTLVNDWFEDNELNIYKSANSIVLGVNASIVYSYEDSKFIKFGEIVENIDIMEDKSWFVYPSLLLSIIFIIIF